VCEYYQWRNQQSYDSRKRTAEKQRKILDGYYRCHIRLLKRQEEQRLAMAEDLRQELFVGAKQLDTGKSLPFDAVQVSEIKSQGRQKAGQ